MEERTFRLTSDIQNPQYDGRCKRGARSVKVFKSGTLVRARLWKPLRVVEGVDLSYTTYSIQCEFGRFDDVGMPTDSAPPALPAEIAKQDPGVEMPIQTLEEAAAQTRTNVSDFCRYVVRQLIKEGRLNPAETKELYEKTDENDW